MCRQFNRLNTGIIGPSSNREPMSDETFNICRCNSEVAPMKTHKRYAPAERVHSSSWNGSHGALLRDQAAGQPIDHERLVGLSRFGVVGISEARHIPSKLNDCVLKAAACSKKWL